MAEIQQLYGTLGQIKLGPLTVKGPIKIRVSGRFIPSFTIDLSKKPTKAEKTGILNVINPKVTMLIGDVAYEFDYATRELKEADPAIFNKDTFLDTVSKLGVIPTIAIITGTALIALRILRR